MDRHRSRVDSRPSEGPAGSPRRAAPRVLARGLLLVALAGASLSLTQCRLVGDRLTGVRASQFRASNECFRTCREGFQEALRAERQLHQDKVAACVGDGPCLAEEGVRHANAVQSIETAFRACVTGCHHQGGGTAGY